MNEEYDNVRLGFLLSNRNFWKNLKKFGELEIEIEILNYNTGEKKIVNWKPFFIDVATDNAEEFLIELKI